MLRCSERPTHFLHDHPQYRTQHNATPHLTTSVMISHLSMTHAKHLPALRSECSASLHYTASWTEQHHSITTALRSKIQYYSIPRCMAMRWSRIFSDCMRNTPDNQNHTHTAWNVGSWVQTLSPQSVQTCLWDLSNNQCVRLLDALGSTMRR